MRRALHKQFLLIIVLFIMLTTAINAYATSWYLDNSATGKNDGTSWVNAWETPPDIVWGAGGVYAGDTLFISGGTISKTYTADRDGYLSVGASGTSQNPITVRIGQDAGHNGIAIFDGSGIYRHQLEAVGYDWIIFDGGYNGERRIIVQNGFGTLVRMSNGHYSVIKNIEMKSSPNGLYFANRSDPGTGWDIDIDNVYIHDITGNRAIQIQGLGNRYDIYKIHHSIIQVNHKPGGEGGIGPDAIGSLPNGATVYNNVIYGANGTVVGGQHQDGIQVLTARYHKIYNNLFYDLANSALIYETFGSIGDPGYFHLYNNVFAVFDPTMTGYLNALNIKWWNEGKAGSAIGLTLQDVFIDNNTFIDFDGFIAVRITWPENLTIGELEIKNNLFYNDGKPGSFHPISIGPPSLPCDPGVTIDYNLLSPGPSGSTLITCGTTNPFIQTHAFAGTPSFISYTEHSIFNDFRLASDDTAARNNGVSLSTQFTTDKNGITRPQGAAWDIGAYEYIRVPTPPTNLLIQ